MIRRYQNGDEIRIGAIFHEAIHELARADYTPEQLDAWGSRHTDADYWRKRCERKRPFVKVQDGNVVGFIELDPDGHIGCTYVDPAYAGKGVMTEIMGSVKAEAIKLGLTKLFAEVSKTARPFFQRNGFVWVRNNRVDIRGVSLDNFVMECDLKQAPGNRDR